MTPRFPQRRRPRIEIVVLLVMGSIPPCLASDPIVHRTNRWDFLEDALHAPGTASTPFENGEAVDLFTGNLRVTHPSSPNLPITNSLGMLLTRTYNSNNVYHDRVLQATGPSNEYNYYWHGRSWVGAGWTSHLGRIFLKPTFRGDENGEWDNLGRERYFEDPSGAIHKFVPYVKKARPALDIQYHADLGDPDCSSPPWVCFKFPQLCDPENCPDPPVLDDWYSVTLPNGTVYELRRILQDNQMSDGWVSNNDRAGYYTTKITDIHGNEIRIEYWGTEQNPPPFYEAIKRIWSPQAPGPEITTVLCSAADETSTRCPVGSRGMLKEVHATGFEGVDVVYEFFYEARTVPLDPEGLPYKNGPPIVLTEVRLPSGAIGSIYYEYGEGFSGVPPTTDLIQLLDRIHYPQGAVSAYEYVTWMGGRYVNDPNLTRNVKSVTKRRLFPGGLGGTANGLTMPHYTWLWDREFDVEFDAGEDCENVDLNDRVSDFSITGPDGLSSVTTMFGQPCGDTSKDWGPDGAPKTTIVYDTLDQPFRTIEHSPYYETHNDSDEKIKKQEQFVETTYHDYTQACFESPTPVSPLPTMRQTLRHRDEWGQWRMAITEGDFLPANGAGGYKRIEYTNYHAPDHLIQPCFNANHIVGAFDERFVEEGFEGSATTTRFEETHTFDCQGSVTDIEVHDEWVAMGVVLAANPTSDVIPANQATDADDLATVRSYSTDGQLQSESSGGGDDYPDGTPSNDYSVALTWNHGQIATAQPDGLSYLTADATVDASGLVVSSRDPNGLETTLFYDALGRPTVVDPPGATEYATRMIYPSLNEVRTITSPGTEQGFQPADSEQIYNAQFLDGLGRPTKSESSHPDGTKSVQVVRYDQLGRAIFTSAWMSEAEFANASKISWQSGDHDGDGVNDYSVTDVPVRSGNGRPWGTVAFFGTPDPSAPGNPLKAIPDPLGRLVRVEGPDGEAVDRGYCGPHEQITVHDVQTSIQGSVSVVTRNYYDGLGRLVLVDAPPASVDAAYSYDARGNLTKANLVTQLPANPFEAWRQGPIANGQVRTFSYDAAGRLTGNNEPETGQQVVSGYDSGGNVLTWQDSQGLVRRYFFENTYDLTGRFAKTERVQGTPSAPATVDVDLVGSAGDFDEPGDLSTTPGSSVWVEGTLTHGGTIFTPGESYWRQVGYGGCLESPPDDPSNAGALYLGENCTYDSAPLGPQAVQFHLTGVTRDDALSFKFLRSVRYGEGDKDQFYVLATLAGDGDGLLGARNLFYLDQQQASYATWRQTDAIRLGDFFSNAEWPEQIAGLPTTRNVNLYFVFEKKNLGSTGLGLGVLIDDVVVGRKARETLVEYDYDVDECAGGQNSEACNSGEEPTNRPKGSVTKLTSYQNGRVVSEQTLIYKGLNGRLSVDEMAIDWAGVGDLQEFVSRYLYSPLGQVDEFHAPYTPGIESTRKYFYSFNRGYLGGIRDENEVAFIPTGSPPSVTYGPSGVLESLLMGNDILHTYSRDDVGGLQSLDVARAGQGTETLWATGFYDYDGVGNITGIGGQQFAYDEAGRLTAAHVLPQATNPQDTNPYLTSYTYDSLGNMTERTWSKQGNPNAPSPPGMPADRTFSTQRNQVTDPGFAYDLNGNLTRGKGSSGSVSASWDSLGRMTTFAQGQPDKEQAFVKFGSPMRHYTNTNLFPPLTYITGTNWTNAAYNDIAPPWLNGTYGVGYDESGEAEDLLSTELFYDSGFKPTSTYTRAYFSIPNEEAIESLHLGVDYDDGYVAWINGVEVYRSPEMPAGAPNWNTVATPHESSNLHSPNYGALHDVSTVGVPLLQSFSNVLAIGVWNQSGNADDLVLVPRLSANRSPEGHRVVARYAYDANGYRLVEHRDGANGMPRISIRDGSGNVLSEFIVNPGTGAPVLVKDFVYGLGQLLVERTVNSYLTEVLENNPLVEGGNYSFTVSDDSEAESYTVDIRTPSGYVNHLTGVVPTNTKILLAESQFSLGETNFIRIHPEGVGEAGYSPPVTLTIDPTVTSSSANKTRAIGVTRSGADFIVNFSLLQPNGNTDGYFRRDDTGQYVQLTTPSLTPMVRTFTVGEQNLAVPCGEIKTRQNGSYSAGVLPPILEHIASDPGDPCNCGGSGPGDYNFIDYYHHRDHLGNLRLVTDEAGYEIGAHDFYPFGTEIDQTMVAMNDSRIRYTGHRRDELTDTYYMKARFKLESEGFFSSPDSAYDVSLFAPVSWNKYSYVQGNPVNLVDPSGMFWALPWDVSGGGGCQREFFKIGERMETIYCKDGDGERYACGVRAVDIESSFTTCGSSGFRLISWAQWRAMVDDEIQVFDDCPNGPNCTAAAEFVYNFLDGVGDARLDGEDYWECVGRNADKVTAGGHSRIGYVGLLSGAAGFGSSLTTVDPSSFIRHMPQGQYGWPLSAVGGYYLGLGSRVASGGLISRAIASRIVLPGTVMAGKALAVGFAAESGLIAGSMLNCR